MHIANTELLNPSAEDIAWAAGLYEGEGSFFYIKHYYKNGKRFPRKTFQPHLRIGMTDKEPLEKWQSILGGILNGPYSSNKRFPSAKPHWMLRLDCKSKSVFALKSMWNHLSPRRKEQFK